MTISVPLIFLSPVAFEPSVRTALATWREGRKSGLGRGCALGLKPRRGWPVYSNVRPPRDTKPRRGDLTLLQSSGLKTHFSFMVTPTGFDFSQVGGVTINRPPPTGVAGSLWDSSRTFRPKVRRGYAHSDGTPRAQNKRFSKTGDSAIMVGYKQKIFSSERRFD
jgi:hypothetical protein